MTIRLCDEGGMFMELEPDLPNNEETLREAVEDDVLLGGAEGADAAARSCEGSQQWNLPAPDHVERDGGSHDGSHSRELELEREVATLSEEKEQLAMENGELLEEQRQLLERNTALAGEVNKLKEDIGREKKRCRSEWVRSCQLLIEYDELLAEKDKEIARLQTCLEHATARPDVTTLERERRRGRERETPSPGMEYSVLPSATSKLPTTQRSSHDASRDRASSERRLVRADRSPRSGLGKGGRVDASHRGERQRSATLDCAVGEGTRLPEERIVTPARRAKAPPVDPFSGEATGTFEDWLPSLQRAAAWNSCSDEEKLLQLAGHLRGRALQEWNLLQGSDKSTFEDAVCSLRTRLDLGSRALAAQDFRHTLQHDQESEGNVHRDT